MNDVDEKRAIDTVVNKFFSAFDNRNAKPAKLDALRSLFSDNAIIVKTCGESPVTYNIDEFINPRRELLSGGGLEEFSERELWERTTVFGCMAQRLCAYRKSGVLGGKMFETDGMKSMQFVRTDTGWKITAVIWDDERARLTVPPFPG